jgi:hypothetical protein
MRSFVATFVMAVFLGLSGAPAYAASLDDLGTSQQPFGRSTFHKADYGGYCERLRLACVYKEERGEQGEGNCRRYRAECGRVSYCERLRRACVHKEERGESGQGNCRRYRNECD